MTTNKEFIEDQESGQFEPDVRYVDLDSEVQVKSGINVLDNQDEVLRAATMFMKSPNRALSARELAILLYSNDPKDDFTDEGVQEFIDSLVESGFIHEVNELDGAYKRYRVV